MGAMLMKKGNTFLRQNYLRFIEQFQGTERKRKNLTIELLEISEQSVLYQL